VRRPRTDPRANKQGSRPDQLEVGLGETRVHPFATARQGQLVSPQGRMRLNLRSNDPDEPASRRGADCRPGVLKRRAEAGVTTGTQRWSLLFHTLWIAAFTPVHTVFLGVFVIWLGVLACVLRAEALNARARAQETPSAGLLGARAGWMLLALVLIFGSAGLVRAVLGLGASHVHELSRQPERFRAALAKTG
jgi:hypothetical protein